MKHLPAVKYIKENWFFITLLIALTVISFNQQAKSFVLKGLLETGLFAPDIDRDNRDKRKAPSAAFLTANGIPMNIASSEGKVIFINFWADWCPPCIAEMPSINKLAGHFKDKPDVLFLMADVEGKLGSSTDYMRKKGYDLRVFVPVGTMPQELFKGILPTTLLINKRGEVVYKHEGIADYDSRNMRDFIEELLKE